jgi:hypothetical protein
MFLPTVALIGAGMWIVLSSFRQRPIVANPLIGFKVLSLPRSEAFVGSPWQQDLGPTQTGGFPYKLVVSRSLDEAEIYTSGDFGEKASSALVKDVSIKANASQTVVSSIRLKKISVVRIADASSLRLESGQSYIWEALRVDQFSATSDGSRSSDASLLLKQAFPGASIGVEGSGATADSIDVSGVGLFVAYRIVRAQSLKPETLATYTLTSDNATSEFELGSDLRVRIENVYPGQSLLDRKHCKFRLKITSFSTLDKDKKPLQKEIIFDCQSEPDPSYDLFSPTTGTRVAHQLILIRDFSAWPISSLGAKMKGTFELQSHAIELSPVSNPQAPGW